MDSSDEPASKEIPTSRLEIIAQAMYASWAKRHGTKNCPAWQDLVKMAKLNPRYAQITQGWMSDAHAAIEAIPFTRDLTELFTQGAHNTGKANPETPIAFYDGMEASMKIILAWREAMLKGL